MTTQEEIKFFEGVTNEMAATFAKKRHDYGPSTTETWIKFGPVSMITRMQDKLNRAYNLLCGKDAAAVSSESVQDTILDLANYCIITLIEIEKERERLDARLKD